MTWMIVAVTLVLLLIISNSFYRAETARADALEAENRRLDAEALKLKTANADLNLALDLMAEVVEKIGEQARSLREDMLRQAYAARRAPQSIEDITQEIERGMQG